MKLTRRGKIVVGILVVSVFWWLFSITTPKQCNVPIEKMSQQCIDLLYPH